MFLLKIFWNVSTARINQRSSQPLDNFFGPARCRQTVGFVFCLGLLNPCLGLPWDLVVKNPPAKAGDLGSIPGLEDPLEKRMATHSSFLAWRIPWTEDIAGESHGQRSLAGFGGSLAGWTSKELDKAIKQKRKSPCLTTTLSLPTPPPNVFTT